MTIPSGWQTISLGSLVDVLDKKRIPLSAAERKHREGTVPYYGATGQVGTIDKPLFDEPLILLGEDGVQFFDPYKPKAYKISGPSWVNNHAHVLRPKEAVIEFGYLLHYLNAFDYQGYANGTTRLKLTQGAMNSIPVHLPPLDVQRRIVKTLDDNFSRLDKAFTQLDKVDSQTTVLRRSILNAVLSPVVSDDEKGNERTSELPSGWVGKRLGELAQVTMGQSPPGSSYNKNGQGIPFFQGKAEFGVKHPTVRKWTTAGTKFAEPGDIIMSVRAPVGPTNIADTHCSIGRGLAGIRAGEGLDQSYLIWYLKHIEASIQARGKGTTFDAISGNDLRDTVVNLPSLGEQKRIVERLDASLSQLESTRTSIAFKKVSLLTLRRSLLNKAFNGELGTN
jgi:type I restriction enzyme S subunit